MDENKLKPCPFCGGKAVFQIKSNGSSHYDVHFEFTIKCQKCGCELPKTYSFAFTLGDCGQIIPQNDQRKKALELWNRRSQEN